MDTRLLVCVVGKLYNDDSLSAVFSKWLPDMESEIHILSICLFSQYTIIPLWALCCFGCHNNIGGVGMGRKSYAIKLDTAMHELYDANS